MTLEDEKRSMTSVEHVEVLEKPRNVFDDLAISPEDDKRLRRKTDWTIMPLFCAVFMIQFLDKSVLTYSSIMGFVQDSKIKMDQYSWLGSIFYFGYLAGDIPWSNIIIWGVIVCLMTVCGTNYAALLVTRFFLGFFESCISPALMLFTAQWYKQNEQGSRTGLWSSFNTLGLIFGGVVAWALARADRLSPLSMTGWKVMYILLGCMTIAIGILFGLIVPDSKETAWFLSPEDRRLVVRRVAGNRQEADKIRTWRWYQVREAFRDPQCWGIWFISLITAIPNGGITNFSAVVVKGLGFSSEDTLLLGMLKAWVAFFTLGCLWFGDKIKCRSLVSIFPSLVSTAGAIIVWILPKSRQVPRLAGYQLMLSYAIIHVATSSFISSNISGRSKKTTVFGMYFLGYCVGNLIGPQTFRDKDAPRYAPALIVIVICNILAGICMAMLFVYYYRENKRRDASEIEMEGQESSVDWSSQDLTDIENPKFRYHY